MADGDPVFWSPGEIKLKIVHVHSGQALGVSTLHTAITATSWFFVVNW